VRLLLAESDPALATFLQRGFDAENYLVDLTTDAEQAKNLVNDQKYDLAILDLNLGPTDGLNVLREVRSRGAGLPILILSSRGRLEDRIQALDMGADDLVVKPFAFSELSARVRALIRRGIRGEEAVLRAADLELNRVERKVYRGGVPVELTPKEFSLLEYLMRHEGQNVTRSEIIQHVWNLSYDTMTNVVDVYINYSSSQVDKRRVGQLALAIQVAFQKMGIFDASNSHPAVSNTEPMPFSNVQMIENAKRVQALDQLVNSPSGSLTGGPARPDMNNIQAQIAQALAPQIKNHTVNVTQTKEGIIVSLREIGFFDSGSTNLRPQAEPVLASFVKVVKPQMVRIRIEGHTDNVPIHNNRFDSNWELSTARATEIIKLFITKYGMLADRLSASGYAQYHPVASNDTPEGRAINRRVDLVILNPQAEPGFEISSSSAALPPSPGNELPGSSSAGPPGVTPPLAVPSKSPAIAPSN
jgi:DNA-binding response OmpR family regulator/outer membrane protein OmpA-like peptidoglycan-associated protein